MKRYYDNWLGSFNTIELYKSGSAFNEKLNHDLQDEFEKITGFAFDGKGFFLFMKGMGEFSFHEIGDIPVGHLKAKLFFYEEAMEVSIIWFDQLTRKLFKPGEDVSGSNIEFHWYNFDINHPALKELNNKPIDIRKKYGWKLTLPVFSIGDNLYQDVWLKFKLLQPADSEKIDKLLAEVQNQWNMQSLEQHQSSERDHQGLIHSIHFESVDKSGNALFSLDLGTANEKVYEVIFRKVDEAAIQVKRIELIPYDPS